MDLGFTTSEEMAEDFKGGFDIVSPGWKKAVVVKTEIVPTSTGGKMLKVYNELQGAEVKSEAGAIVIDQQNILNKSEIAQRIGRAAIAKMAQCMGIPSVSDSENLCGHQYEIKVGMTKFASKNDSSKMLDSNEVKDYRPYKETKAKNNTSEGENKAW